ncbi:MAG TPA: chromate resistance protein ChrB domain-containing protein [Candidatus Acidoferrum sp.]|jgi:hypothetical protein
MNVRTSEGDPPWLMLTFSLAAKRASQRVEVWRLLQRYGAVALGNSGYLLPHTPVNRERFQWLSTTIRSYKGDASVVEVQSIDNLTKSQLAARFNDARSRDYQALIHEIKKVSSSTSSPRHMAQLTRIRSRFREIASIDFFGSPLQQRVEHLIANAEHGSAKNTTSQPVGQSRRQDYQRKAWVTRPKPGIDRSASAWLIRKFIDKKARFTFAREADAPPAAIRFDMFQGGFGHCGDDCTFETLCKEFRIRDARVTAIGEMVHDADLADAKFGRNEAFGVDEVLKGWSNNGVPDKDLLERGIDMIDALYHC